MSCKELVRHIKEEPYQSCDQSLGLPYNKVVCSRGYRIYAVEISAISGMNHKKTCQVTEKVKYEGNEVHYRAVDGRDNAC